MIEITKMSSKGQVVIPQKAREFVQAIEGSIFAVTSTKDAIILKKINTPSKEELIKELKKIAIEGRKRLESKGIKEKEIPEIVEKSRRK